MANRQPLIDEYQALLRAEEETLATTKRAAALVAKAFGGWFRATASGLEYEPAGTSAPDRSELLKSAALFGNGFAQKQMDEVIAHRPSGHGETKTLHSLTVDCSIGLALIPAVTAEGSATLDEKQYSLLFDACAVLAHHAYFGLLPKLGGPTFERERTLLLSALRRFGDLTPLPADRYAIRALYFEALGQYHRAGGAYRQALAATHADSHEFMTALQTYWAFLLERGLPNDALELLLENYPRVPRRDLEELNELIRQTFKYRATARRRKAPSRRRRP